MDILASTPPFLPHGFRFPRRLRRREMFFDGASSVCSRKEPALDPVGGEVPQTLPISSGSPLLDSKGEMIGINTAIFTQTGTSAGVGFAIPSSTVLKIVPQLIKFGKVVRAGLNVDIAPDLVANQLNVRNRVLVIQVAGDSLAAKAGLLPTTRGFTGNIILGEVIFAVDENPITNKAELFKVLDEYTVGDKVLLKIPRGSENLELPVVLEETTF